MFTPLGTKRTGPKPPRSNGLLLVLVVMMCCATFLLVRDLKHPLIPRDLHSRPTPSDGPIEVIFLDEEGGTSTPGQDLSAEDPLDPSASPR